MSQIWKVWLKHFEFCLTTTEKDGKDDKMKTSVLLACIGKKTKKLYGGFIFDNSNNQFKKHCPRNGKTLHEIEETETESPSADRYKFFLDIIDFQKKKTLKIWLAFFRSKLISLTGILFYPLMVLQYPIK